MKTKKTTKRDVVKIINYLIEECVKLKSIYVSEKDLIADYVCIFSHTQNEYQELLNCAKEMGVLVDDTPTGPVFAFTMRPDTIAGRPKVLKIRKPDEARKERGDVDFNTDYEPFKKKYLDGKKFTLIKREKFEMIQLQDKKFDVLVYFSSISPSKLVGVE